MGTQGSASSPEDFRKITRTMVDLPTMKDGEGQPLRVEIRKLTGMDFLSLGTLPPMAADPNMTKEQRRKQIRELVDRQPKLKEESMRLTLLRGGVKPRLVDTDAAQCPPDAITLGDLGEDAFWLVGAIQDFSGLTEAAAIQAEPFPAKAGSGTG